MDQESTDSETNSRLSGDGDKQILAPAEGPRENLINTAVKFLQNPKVMSSPLYQKKAFLEKKGLTQEEINLAVQRAGVAETKNSTVTMNQGPVSPANNPGMMIANPQIVPIPPQSGWARARDLTFTTVIVASVSYAVYQLFQRYLRPVMFGKSAQENRLERLEGQLIEIQGSVTESLSEMTKTLAAIQTSLNNQQTQVLLGQGEVRGISDLKADIASLKGLLLNRSQFPPAPATSPVLPSWQRTSAQTSATASAAPPTTTASVSYADVVKTSEIAGHSGSHPSTQNQALDLDGIIAENKELSSMNGEHVKPENQDGEDVGNKDGDGLSLDQETDSELTLVDNAY